MDLFEPRDERRTETCRVSVKLFCEPHYTPALHLLWSLTALLAAHQPWLNLGPGLKAKDIRIQAATTVRSLSQVHEVGTAAAVWHVAEHGLPGWSKGPSTNCGREEVFRKKPWCGFSNFCEIIKKKVGQVKNKVTLVVSVLISLTDSRTFISSITL